MTGVQTCALPILFCINDIRRAAGQAIINEPWAWRFWLTKNIAAIKAAAQGLGEQEGGTQ